MKIFLRTSPNDHRHNVERSVWQKIINEHLTVSTVLPSTTSNQWQWDDNGFSTTSTRSCWSATVDFYKSDLWNTHRDFVHSLCVALLLLCLLSLSLFVVAVHRFYCVLLNNYPNPPTAGRMVEVPCLLSSCRRHFWKNRMTGWKQIVRRYEDLRSYKKNWVGRMNLWQTDASQVILMLSALICLK